MSFRLLRLRSAHVRSQRPEYLLMTQPDFLTITHSIIITLVVSAPLDDFNGYRVHFSRR